ncbi:MAG: ribbon-helix-helix protein, CopG family [Luteitalea sp.]|nr:ribbon-helix-helix protein, CopG family [Luteitalea sp.]
MNITLSVDDRLVEEARKLAHARGTSLNQLVRDYLEGLVRPRSVESYGTELRRLTAEGRGGSKGWRFNRDELHERR